METEQAKIETEEAKSVDYKLRKRAKAGIKTMTRCHYWSKGAGRKVTLYGGINGNGGGIDALDI